MNKLSKMNKLINKLSDEKFEYGKNDCFTFTARLVREWHGKNYLAFHLVYKNEDEARAYIGRYRGGIEELTTGTLGYGIEPTACEDGDVVIAEVSPGEIALGFVYGGKGLFKTEKRVGQIPLKKCIKGWRIH
jgi:hypothetical protein